MCQNPSLHHLVEMIRVEELARKQLQETAGIQEQKLSLARANKEAAKNVLLSIQLQLARRSSK